MDTFENKVAVITGGASGIGLALAKEAAQLGMHLVLLDIDQKTLAPIADDFRAQGVNVLAETVDVRDASQMEALAEKVYAEFDAVHLLFNNAGVGSVGKVWESTPADWDWVMGVNVNGVVNGIRAFVPRMIAGGEPGHIVNTASIAGLVTGHGMAIYRVSKHSVVVLSEVLSHELALYGHDHLHASVLCPAWTKTNITTSDRVRPGDIQNAPEDVKIGPMEIGHLKQMQRHIDETGKTPEEIAAATFDAIRNNRFYIITHEEFVPAVAVRMKDLLGGNNPRDLGI